MVIAFTILLPSAAVDAVPTPRSRAQMSKAHLRLGRARDRTGQHDSFRAQAFDKNFASRNCLPDSCPYAVKIARHRYVEAGDLLSVCVEEIQTGLSHGSAYHIDAAGGPH